MTLRAGLIRALVTPLVSLATLVPVVTVAAAGRALPAGAVRPAVTSSGPGASPSSWPAPNGDLSGSRRAGPSPITSANVSTLARAWAVPMAGGLPTSPVIVDGSVFVEDQTGSVARIRLTDGKVAWKTPSTGYTIGPEGVAVGWGKVFGTTSSALFALDERTGHQLWSTPLTHTSTDGVDVQPQVVGHLVIASSVPVSLKGIYTGGDRGFVDAVSADTGHLQWSFDTVASPDLWGNPAVNSGGGSWFPPSYSPVNHLLYVGVANPAPFVGTPQYPNGSSRPGPNLYTDSTVALDVATGQLRWYHQAFPHDLFDRDEVHAMYVSLPATPTEPRTAIVVGTGKGGVVTGMDPSTGRPLWRTRVGRHLHDRLRRLTGPTEILPGTFGGVLTPPAWANGKVYVATLNAPDTLYPDRTEYFGGETDTAPGAVVAIDARSGRHVWATKVPGDPTGGATVVNDLVLTATLQGGIYALRRSSGRIMWHLQAPGGVNGWMSIAGRTVVVPVGLGKTPTVMALRLPEGAG